MPDRELHVAVPPAALQQTAPGESRELREALLARELARMRGREAAWEEERARLLHALEAAETELAELPALRREAEVNRDAAYWLAVTRASWGWKAGAPGRAVARLVRRLVRRSP